MAVLEGAAQQLSNGVGLKIWLEVGRDLCLPTYAAPEVPYGTQGNLSLSSEIVGLC